MSTRLNFSLATALVFVAIGCGPGGPSNNPDANVQDGGCVVQTPQDAGACTGSSPCECAERGAPNYCGENEGAPSPSSDEAQRAALIRANHWRTSAGLLPFDADAQIEQAALAHAHFMAINPRSTCWPGVHNEVAGCEGYTGESMGARMTAAGYAWSRASEVINWESDPAHAIDGWIWTVYHRQPFMDWRYVHVGFGRERGPFGSSTAYHNVMDFGAPRNSTARPPAQPAVFPVPGQTDVPPSFRGDLEGPTPPGPGGGTWPRGVASGTVISVHFPGSTWSLTTHRIFLAGGACQEVPSTFISRDNDANLRNANDVFLYANEPLRPGTEYVVQFEGTVNGAPWSRIWAFTTH